MLNVSKSSCDSTGAMNCVILGVPCITDCIVGELEKLGSQFSVALKYVEVHTHATHTHTSSVIVAYIAKQSSGLLFSP